MKYMLLIHQGTTPLPGSAEWDEPVGGGAGRGLRRLQGDQRRRPASPRRPDAASRDGNHGAGAGRQDADHGRPVRRDSRRRSAATASSRPTTSTPRSSWPRGSRRPAWAARSRCGRWWSGSDPRAGLPRAVGPCPRSLIGFLGDFDLAEEAAQEAFAIAAERWPRDGAPADPGAWLVTTARNRAIDRIRRDRTLAAKTRLLEVPEASGGSGGRDDISGRATRARLHLLSSGARHRRAGRPHPAHARRPHHRRDRARVPGARADDGAAAGAGEAQDQGGRDPVPRASGPPVARSARRRARGRLPDLQRGVRRPRRAGGARRCGSGARSPS